MTWTEKVKNGIIITTGDGKEYRPLYVIAPKKYDFNVAEFEFPEIEGTLVVRKKKKGTRHTLDLYFQGDTHLDEILDFENSANDERPWKVYFPFYGNTLVQPISLAFDTTGLNNSKVTCELVETITSEYPKITINSKDKAVFDVNNVKSKTVESFSNNVVPNTSDLNKIKNDVAKAKQKGDDAIKSESQAIEYLNLYNEVNAAILLGSSGASSIAATVNNFLIFPSFFVSNLEGKFNLLKNQFLDLSNTLNLLLNPNSKAIYQLQAGSIITALVNSTLNTLSTDFTNSDQVLSAIDQIVFLYNSYIENLDSLQTENGGEVDSFVPDYTAISVLSDLVNFTISQLFSITLTTKQQRSIILESDSNLILLAHRFYGLDASDSIIESFMSQNNIGISELLVIKAGRKIIYYV